MQNLARPRARLRTAALLPVAVVAWLTMGTGAAMAAPSAHSAAAASSTPAAAAQMASSANGNGNGNGNGKANGQDNGNGKGQDKNAAPATPAAPVADSNSSGGSSDHSSGNAGTSGDPTQPQPVSNADQNPGGANGKCPGGPYCSTRDGSPSGNGNGNGQAKGKPCAGCVGKADNKNPKGQYPNGSDHNAGYECDRNHGIGRTNPAHTGCTSTPTCPEGQVMDDNGNCTTPGCPEGQVMDDNGNCTTPGCPEGQVMDDNGDCTTPGCPEGQVMGDNGECTTPGCPEGEVMGANGECTVPDCDTATTDCGENDCTTDEDCGTPPPNCVPTAANHFCSTVEGEHHTRKPPTKVLGEKVTRTPSVLPFTGAAGIGMMIGTAALAMSVGGGLMIASRRRRGQAG